MRERMVTRTIISTEVTALVVLLNEGTTEVQTFTIPREHKDADEILKYCRKHINNDDITVVKVLEMKTSETYYGVSEADFLKIAKVLPKKSTKN